MLWQMMVDRLNCRTDLSKFWQYDYRRGQSIQFTTSLVKKNIYSNWPTYESDDTRGVARCYLWLFTLYINIKISKNSC